MLFDRNNHKAAHHGALLLGGGIPIYLADRPQRLWPDRADLPGRASTKTAIREKIRDNPLVDGQGGVAKRERPFRVAVIEQCTYDGTIYDAETISSGSATSATISCSTRPGRAS